MPNQTKFKKFSIFGVEVDAVTNQQAIDYIATQAANPLSPAQYVTKPYVEFLDQAYHDSSIKALLNQSALCIPDGVALNWATTYLYGGRPSLWRWFTTLCQIVFSPRSIHQVLPDRASGTKFAWALLRAASDKRLRIFLLGTPNRGRGDIRQTAAAIKKHLPEVNIVGSYGGYFPPGNKNELVQALKVSNPDLILVGMGFPKQENLMASLCQTMPHGVMVGEGGTFDYRSFGGQQPKAPTLIQKIGFEWLWRLILQPNRLRRQLAIPRFMWRVYREGKRGDLQ